MPNSNYIFDILKTLHPSLKMRRKQENLLDPHLTMRNVTYGLTLRDEDWLELELRLYYSKIYLNSLFPYRGIVSCGPFIAQAEDPICNGFMDSEGNLTQMGTYYLFRLLNDVLNIERVIRRQPNAILELYAVCFGALLEQDSSLIFGKIPLTSGTRLTRTMSNLVNARFGFEVEWPVDLFHSFQNVIVNHPEIFRGNLN